MARHWLFCQHRVNGAKTVFQAVNLQNLCVWSSIIFLIHSAALRWCCLGYHLSCTPLNSSEWHPKRADGQTNFSNFFIIASLRLWINHIPKTSNDLQSLQQGKAYRTSLHFSLFSYTTHCILKHDETFHTLNIHPLSHFCINSSFVRHWLFHPSSINSALHT